MDLFINLMNISFYVIENVEVQVYVDINDNI